MVRRNGEAVGGAISAVGEVEEVEEVEEVPGNSQGEAGSNEEGGTTIRMAEGGAVGREVEMRGGRREEEEEDRRDMRRSITLRMAGILRLWTRGEMDIKRFKM